MNTIANRLREIANKCKRHRHQPPTSYEDGEELCRIAAELEAAPAADAMEPDCWAICTPNGSRLVSPNEAKGRKDAYPLYTHAAFASTAAELIDAKATIAALQQQLDAWVKAATEAGALLPDATGMPRATASTVGLQAQIASLRAQTRRAEDVVEAAKHRIAELGARQVPDGWVAVPREPTPAMLMATGIQDTEYYFRDLDGAHSFMTDAYREMLAAAPSNPTTQPPEWRDEAQQEQSK